MIDELSAAQYEVEPEVEVDHGERQPLAAAAAGGWSEAASSNSPLPPRHKPRSGAVTPSLGVCEPFCCDKKGRPTQPCPIAPRILLMEAPMLGFDRITFDPNILGGKACIRGMRISVSLIVNLVANGMTATEIVAEYPNLEEEDVAQALRYAA